MFMHHYIVIDNFYEHPDGVRDIAMQMSAGKNHGNYAGNMTDDAFWTQEHLQMFQRLTGEVLQAGTQLNGKFRFSMQADVARQHIHFDPAPAQIWAGVVYLTPDHLGQEQGVDLAQCGTVFWQHKRTGLTRLPLEQQQRDAYGWHTVDDLKHFLETDGCDESLWKQTLSVGMQYNRLVLFRPWLFHSPGRWFGDSRENCRLIQTFFLRSAEDLPLN